MEEEQKSYNQVINEYFDYDFELPRVCEFISDASTVVLQFPEGLIRYATKIANYIQSNTKAMPIILGDVVYGACNFDEYIAEMFETKKYIHFGHSQIVRPFSSTLDCLFVPCKLLLQQNELTERKGQLLSHIKENGYKSIQLTATAQTNHLVQEFITFLSTSLPDLYIKRFQFKTLPENELLGCTCRKIQGVDAVYSVVDGLFHMEAVKVAGGAKVYQFNLIAKTIVWLEENDLDVQKRKEQRITIANEIGNKFPIHRFNVLNSNKSEIKPIKLNIVFGTLGRQSSVQSLRTLEQYIQNNTDNISYLIQPLQEIFPFRLNSADVNVQLSCPRLTFDWGSEFQKNVLGLWEFWQLLQHGKLSEYMLLNFSGDIEEAGIYLDFHDHGQCQ